jgi:hypothetical protein
VTTGDPAILAEDGGLGYVPWRPGKPSKTGIVPFFAASSMES